MLIEMLIAWAIVVPALVVVGLYLAASYLGRCHRSFGTRGFRLPLDEVTAMREPPSADA